MPVNDPSRRVPADRGLSGLGLLMQLAGSVFAAIGAVWAAQCLQLFEVESRFGTGHSDRLLWLVLVAGSAIVRSLIHRQAGADLIHGPAPYQGIRRYLVVSLINAGAWLAYLTGQMHAPALVFAPILSVLLAWPVALFVMTNLAGFRELASEVPPGEDKGFEGAGLLMLIFGLSGLIGTSLVLYMRWTGTPGEMHSDPSFMLTVLALAVLIGRSALHVAGALRCLRETRLDVAVAAVNRYADFGIAAAFLVGGALLVAMLIEHAELIGLLVVGCTMWMLLAWPLAVRRFFGERQFADLVANANADGAPSSYRRAPDLGLTTLGWLLFASGLVSLAFWLPATLLMPADFRMALGAADNPLAGVLSLINPGMDHSPWWGIGLNALEIWAGFELIRMGELHRAAATAYGVITTALMLYFVWPALSDPSSLPEGGVSSSAVLASFAFALIIPLTTLFAANRSAVPAATARFKR
jgi:hypothetical protein